MASRLTVTDMPSARAAVRILLVDGNRLFRAGIRTLLSQHSDLAVLDDVESGADALKVLQTQEPDVVLMEVNLPDMDGLEVLKQLRAASDRVQVLFLTTVDDAEALLSAAEAGAAGYVLKDISPENLANAIRAVHEGRTMINPVLARRMLARLAAKAKDGAPPDKAKLGENEVLILSRVALGMSDREIATKLHLSEATVKKQLRRIYGKLGARNRAQAALLAVKLNLIT
ncbi:MAG TPA: response regulator transcription factor [bacterium]|nr:response regulator transcription factor [bacterium]